MQEYVVVVRRSRRTLCGSSSSFGTQVARLTERTTECEELARSIAVFQDDLSEGMSETVSQFDRRASAVRAEDTVGNVPGQ
ncbi:hypothetical protein JG688_00006859 [Phytophthora aleatoria]|uniref:Uncharacterized protein n=1 Tax=Phytophthora aleatoria TaxID=2496075 RepID=A0A8J5M8K2_9STRA|nr:hypothetical protein JG688_00006859 [Phytophthora aleatoria]